MNHVAETAYVCAPCGEFFYEPLVHHDREKEEFWGEPVINVTRFEMCPSCGSEDITEVMECEGCGMAAAMDGCHDCAACAAKLEEGERLAETLVGIGRAGAGEWRTA